jgi:hypothetical protein
MTMIAPKFLEAAIDCDPESRDATSLVAVWVTPTEKALGFLRCVADEDRMAVAKLLRDHADIIDPR